MYLSTKGDDKLNLQNNVKKIRQAKGVKQKSVAEFLNISQMRYSRIFRCRCVYFF
ncbi:helix-turn-helix domain-containing protein [Companilactobacillus paralimentarius]|uniref:helix-turn-helix domain-containing protein n=1 Tax=Companilactobacillus paralimentarius TaxID=83526 RepID=UPI00384B2A43